MPRWLVPALPLLLSLLVPALARAEPAPPPPACPETERLTIPVTPLVQDRFAAALNKLCADLKTAKFDPANVTDLPPASLAPARTARQFSVDALVAAVTSQGVNRSADAVASLSALKKTCEAVALRRIDVQDVQNLREFRAHTPDMLFVMDALVLNQTALKGVFSGSAGTRSSGEGFVAAPWQSLEENLVTGLTTFVVDRAKAESILYLSQQLRRTLCMGEAQPYFRNLCVALGDLDVKIQLSAMGTYLQAAAQKDLEELPDVMLGQVACKNPQAAPTMMAARLGLAFYREARASRHPLEIARSLQYVESPCAQGTCTALMDAVKVGSRLTDAIQRQSGWELLPLAAPDDLKWRHYALGALFTFEAEQGLQIPDADIATALDVLDGSQHEVVAIANALQQMSAEPDKYKPLDMAVQVTRAVSVLVQLGAEGSQRWLHLTPEQTHALRVARDVAHFGERSMDDRRPGPLALALNDLRVSLKQDAPELQLPAVVDRGMPLVVELANATSSDQVAKTLETAAAPVGSYRRKFERFTVSLNALVGVSGGMEWLEDGSTATNSPVLSLTAPVGVHAAWPTSDNLHLGVMVSVLDLGNLAAFRLKNEVQGGTTTVRNLPRASFSQVFGPGFYGTVGLGLGTTPRSPLLVGAGVSVVPGGREVTTATGTTEHTAVRASLFLAVDVTLLPF